MFLSQNEETVTHVSTKAFPTAIRKLICSTVMVRNMSAVGVI